MRVVGSNLIKNSRRSSQYVSHINKKTSRLVVVVIRRDGDGSAAKLKYCTLLKMTKGSGFESR